MDAPVLADQQRPYVHQLSVDTGWNLEDLPETMQDRDLITEFLDSLLLSTILDADDDFNTNRWSLQDY